MAQVTQMTIYPTVAVTCVSQFHKRAVAQHGQAQQYAQKSALSVAISRLQAT